MIYCTKCKRDKETTDFSPSCIRGDRGMCKECFRKCPSQNKDGVKKYRNSHKELIKEWKQQDYINNRITYLLSNAKKRAVDRNLEFTITRKDVVIPEFCPILGIPIYIEAGEGRTGHGPSIDRVDNTKGYTPDNILIVSDRANLLKADSTEEERRLMFYGYKKLLINQILES